MSRLVTKLSKELSEGLIVILKETSDGRRKVIEFKSDIPISDELLLGCLLIFLESQAPDLPTVPTDSFDCH